MDILGILLFVQQKENFALSLYRTVFFFFLNINVIIRRGIWKYLESWIHTYSLTSQFPFEGQTMKTLIDQGDYVHRWFLTAALVVIVKNGKLSTDLFITSLLIKVADWDLPKIQQNEWARYTYINVHKATSNPEWEENRRKIRTACCHLYKCLKL